jgi:hypothetical protein
VSPNDSFAFFLGNGIEYFKGNVFHRYISGWGP